MKLQDGTFLYLKKLTKPDDKQSWHASEQCWVKYKPDSTELGTRSWLGTRLGVLRRGEGSGKAH